MTDIVLSLRGSLERLNIGKGKRANIGGILDKIGCAYFTESRSPRFIPHNIENPTSEALVREALLCMLRELGVETPLEDVSTLMLAFVHNGRWKDCLETPFLARQLAFSALVQIPRSTDSRGALQGMFRSFALVILNAWLVPATPFDERTADDVIYRHLFGSPWWDLVGEPAGKQTYAAAVAALHTQAEFAPGVLPGKTVDMPLPSLD